MIYDAIAGALPELRREAEGMMRDACVIRYATGSTTSDPVTGSDIPEYAVRFTTRCKIQARNLVVQDAEVGGRTSQTVRAELHIPVDSPAVSPGDIAEITAVGALSDMSLLGRKFTIAGGTPPKSLATARRLEIEQVVS